MSNSDRQQHVNWWLEREVPVLPVHGFNDGSCTCRRKCPNPGKHPATKHGVYDASRSKEVWAKYPPDRFNYGVATGSRSNLLVIDVDTHGETDSAKEDFVELTARLGPLPAAACVRTGGDGLHFYFVIKKGYRAVSGKLANRVDVLGENGYVIGPGSTHRSGKTYGWSGEPPKEFPELPNSWIGELVKMGRLVPVDSDLSTDTESAVDPGSARVDKESADDSDNPGRPRPLTTIELSTVVAGLRKENEVGRELVSSAIEETGRDTLCPETLLRNPNVERLIQRTLPTEPKTRNHSVFDLARGLKKIVNVDEMDVLLLQPVVDEWYRRLLDRIGPSNVNADAEENWDDFLHGYFGVKYPSDVASFSRILYRSRSVELPNGSRGLPTDAHRRLMRLLLALGNEYGDRPFFLSVSTAHLACEFGCRDTAWKALRLFEHLGVIKCIKKGQIADRMASTYVLLRRPESN